MFRNEGYSYCCASTVEFVAKSDWWRDDYRCTKCDSIPRERAVMYCIERFFPQWRNLTIHESSPVSDRGASRRLMNEAPGYGPSHYYPNVAPGEIVNGIRREDLAGYCEGTRYDRYGLKCQSTKGLETGRCFCDKIG